MKYFTYLKFFLTFLFVQSILLFSQTGKIVQNYCTDGSSITQNINNLGPTKIANATPIYTTITGGTTTTLISGTTTTVTTTGGKIVTIVQGGIMSTTIGGKVIMVIEMGSGGNTNTTKVGETNTNITIGSMTMTISEGTTEILTSAGVKTTTPNGTLQIILTGTIVTSATEELISTTPSSESDKSEEAKAPEDSLDDYFKMGGVKIGVNIPELFVPNLGAYGELFFQNYRFKIKNSKKLNFGFKFSLRTSNNSTIINPNYNFSTSYIDVTVKTPTDSIALVTKRASTDIYKQERLGRINFNPQLAYNAYDQKSEELQIGLGIPVSLYWFYLQNSFKNEKTIKMDTTLVHYTRKIAFNNHPDTSNISVMAGMIGIETFFRYQGKEVAYEGKWGYHHVFGDLQAYSSSTKKSYYTVEADFLYRQADIGIHCWLGTQVLVRQPSWGIFFYKRFSLKDILK